jgi:hypothetical protein
MVGCASSAHIDVGLARLREMAVITLALRASSCLFFRLAYSAMTSLVVDTIVDSVVSGLGRCKLDLQVSYPL